MLTREAHFKCSTNDVVSINNLCRLHKIILDAVGSGGERKPVASQSQHDAPHSHDSMERGSINVQPDVSDADMNLLKLKSPSSWSHAVGRLSGFFIKSVTTPKVKYFLVNV